MKLTDNNALNTLIVVNVIALIAIFTLLWILWKDDAQVPVEKITLDDVNKTVIDTPIKDNQPSTSEEVDEKKLSMSERIRFEVGSTEKLLENEIDKVPARSSSLADVKDLSELSDIEYVVQYQKTKNDVQPERALSSEDVTTVKVVKNTDTSNLKKFNNIDVSGLKNRTEMLDSITTRISSLMNSENDPDEMDTVKTKEWDDYLDSIKSAELERKNEMRTIRVKAGETLWEIAARAYGNGFLYKKIFEANPQLTNPNLIVAGQELRVPL